MSYQIAAAHYHSSPLFKGVMVRAFDTESENGRGVIRDLAMLPCGTSVAYTQDDDPQSAATGDHSHAYEPEAAQ